MSDKFPALLEGHPLVGKPCAACREPFQPGESLTLVPLGPGDDPAARERCREGRPYNAMTAPVHWACATGEE